MIVDGPSDGNWKDPRAHVSEIATYHSALSAKAEERRYFGYMGGHLETVRHVLPVSDWLAGTFVGDVPVWSQTHIKCHYRK